MGLSPDAEKVLEGKSVPEAREEERRTRAAVEEKRGELRELVGASYRDLIDSADNIMEMKHKAADVSERLAQMRAGFDALIACGHEKQPREERSREAEKAKRERQMAFRLGSRVKYLVDAPEQIYGFLDVGAYISAAERLLRARHVHALLVDGAADEILNRFPLLNVQWPATEALSAVLLTRSTASLRTVDAKGGDDASAAVSGALAAAALAGDLDSESCLVVLLEAREALLGNAFAAGASVDAAAGSEGETQTVGILQDLVRIVKGTVGLVALLFMGSSPVLLSTSSDGMSRDALFGGIVDVGPEMEAWKDKVDEVNARMEALPGEEVSTSLQAWLDRAVDLIAARGADLMRTVSSMSELADVERQMREFDSGDETVSFCRAWIETEAREASERSRGDGSNAAVSSSGGHSVNISGGDWSLLCASLLGKEYNVWDSLLDGLFVRRVEELLEASLVKVDIHSQLCELLRVSMTQTHRNGTAPGDTDRGEAGGVDSRSEGDQDEEMTDSDALMCQRWSGDGWAFGSKKGAYGVGEFCRHLDRQLITTAHGVQEVIGCAGESTSDAYNARAAAVMPLLYRETRRAVERNIAHLDNVLASVSAGEDTNADQCGVHDIRRAVVVGHLCRAIANECEMIPLLLSPLQTWPGTIRLFSEQNSQAGGGSGRFRNSHGWASHGGIGGGSSSGRSHVTQTGRAGGVGDANSHFEELKRELIDKSRSAFQKWIEYTVEQARRLFERDLQTDATFKSKAAPMNWETIAIPVKVDSGEKSEMKLVLPSSSSAPVLNLLFRGLCEMQSVGICRASERDVKRAYAFALRSAALDVIARRVAGVLDTDKENTNANTLSEKGRVQLLFDIDLLVDVLAGASPFPSASSDADAGASVARDVRALQLSVSDAIDPIDWATYEPHLKKLEEKYYHRTSVLLGEFVHLNRLHRGMSAHSSVGTSSSDAGIHASAPRFAYLPVSMPVVRSGLASSRRLAKTLKMNKLSKSGAADPRQMGTSLLEGDGDVSNKTLDFKSFVDSIGLSGKAVNYNLGDITAGGLFSSLTGRT